MWTRRRRRLALVVVVATTTVAAAPAGPAAWAQSSAAESTPQTLWREFPLEPGGAPSGARAGRADRADRAATLVADRRPPRAPAPAAAAEGGLPLGLVALAALAGLVLLGLALREAHTLPAPGAAGAAAMRRRLEEAVTAEPDWRAVRVICAIGFGALVGVAIAGTWT